MREAMFEDLKTLAQKSDEAFARLKEQFRKLRIDYWEREGGQDLPGYREDMEKYDQLNAEVGRLNHEIETILKC